jgi:hypothetical protein
MLVHHEPSIPGGEKQGYVRHLFLCRSAKAIETRLQRFQVWFNAERAHQGPGQRTPDDVYFDRPVNPTRKITGGTLHVRFHDGDRRLPILRLRDAALAFYPMWFVPLILFSLRS